MRRAEQQLTRVKVDIIRCHSHFLPKTQWKWGFFFFLPLPFPLVYFHPKARRWKKKRCSLLMRLDCGAFNGHQLTPSKFSRRRLASFFIRCLSFPFFFVRRQSDQIGQFTVHNSCSSDAPQAGREKRGAAAKTLLMCILHG